MTDNKKPETVAVPDMLIKRIADLEKEIAELRQKENTLKKSEEKYQSIMDRIDDAYVELNLAGNITFFNEATSRNTKYPADELMGMNYRQYSSPETTRKMFQIFNDLYRTGNPARIVDFEVIRKDGVKIILEMTATLIKDQDDKPVGFRCLGRDMTEWRKAQKEKEALQRELLQSRKLEAIGTLAGGIAHDFNNLLMGIQGYASLMMMGIDAAHPHYEKLKSIEEQVRSGAELTRQLLGFARGGKYEVRPTNLNVIIDKTVRMFGRTKKELTVRKKFADDLWSAEIDRGQIEQALLNLYVNAWQAMPAGGDLCLETDNVTLEENQVRAYELQPGSYVRLSVTDSGVGMDEKTMERIFDPFFTTKEIGRGTGLGLASVYGIIKNHNGFINVISKRGQGTTFSIYLPASTKKAELESAAPAGLFRGKETILIVDDEHPALDVTRESLLLLGYKTLQAVTGREAVELYRENKDLIDLVILDMVMPGMGGGETFDALKGINPEVKVVLSSGYSIDGEAEGIMARGCRAFIQKPFTISDLSRRIREILDAG